MFGWFKKSGKKEEKPSDAVDVSHLSDAKQKLMAQMREKRAEIGEEELQKMAKAIHMENLKKQIKHDIDHDDVKRQRLIDEIRLNMSDD